MRDHGDDVGNGDGIVFQAGGCVGESIVKHYESKDLGNVKED